MEHQPTGQFPLSTILGSPAFYPGLWFHPEHNFYAIFLYNYNVATFCWCVLTKKRRNLPHLNDVQWWWGERQKRNVSQFQPFSLRGSPVQSANRFIWSFQSKFFQLTSSSSLSITPFLGSFIFFHFLPGHYNPEWLNNNDLWQSSKNSLFEIF